MLIITDTLYLKMSYRWNKNLFLPSHLTGIWWTDFNHERDVLKTTDKLKWGFLFFWRLILLNICEKWKCLFGRPWCQHRNCFRKMDYFHQLCVIKKWIESKFWCVIYMSKFFLLIPLLIHEYNIYFFNKIFEHEINRCNNLEFFVWIIFIYSIQMINVGNIIKLSFIHCVEIVIINELNAIIFSYNCLFSQNSKIHLSNTSCIQ